MATHCTAGVPETTHTYLQGHSLCLKLVSPTYLKCIGVYVWGRGGPGENFYVVCKELYGVACYMGSGIVMFEVQCHATFDARNRTAKKETFLFLNSIFIYVSNYLLTLLPAYLPTYLLTFPTCLLFSLSLLPACLPIGLSACNSVWQKHLYYPVYRHTCVFCSGDTQSCCCIC